MGDNYNDFFNQLTYSGLESFDLYYSMYEAQVTSVTDPDKMGRIQVVCKKVGNVNAPDIWAYPAFMGAGDNRGWFWPPEVGDWVWVGYINGKLNAPPIYLGGWHGSSEVPAELGYPAAKDSVPTRRGFVTRMGHSFTFNDESGKEAVELTWHKPKQAPEDGKSATRDGDKSSLKFKDDGSIELLTKSESSFTINVTDKKIVIFDKDNENTVTLDSNGVTIKTSKKVLVDGASEMEVKATAIKLGDGANEQAVLGNKLLQWLQTHTHPTGVGPSGPPTSPPTPSLLSNTVKVK